MPKGIDPVEFLFNRLAGNPSEVGAHPIFHLNYVGHLSHPLIAGLGHRLVSIACTSSLHYSDVVNAQNKCRTERDEMKRKTIAIDDDIDLLVTDEAVKDRRSFTAQVNILLREALEKRGVGK